MVRVTFGDSDFELMLPTTTQVVRVTSGPPIAVESAAALAIARSPHLHMLQRATRVVIVVSDGTRDEPRAEMLRALWPALGASLPAHQPATITIAVATGTHGPADLSALGIDEFLRRAAGVVNHDGHRLDELVLLGVTRAGTTVRLHRCLMEADLVVALGAVKPHYFAGFGGGNKALFPGLGFAGDIRKNHELKQAPQSRAGLLVGNPCRDDLDEARSLFPVPLLYLNVVLGPDHQVRDLFFGDDAAYRAAANSCGRWARAEVPAPKPDLVIAGDVAPVTDSLYQASKIAAAVAEQVAPSGNLIVVAPCKRGIGPLRVVNEAIFDTGIAPRLARGVNVRLWSCLASEDVAQTRFLPINRDKIGELVAAASHILAVPLASSCVFTI